MTDVNRRDFLTAVGLGASALLLDSVRTHAEPAAGSTKSIVGSWFEFQHSSTVEGVDWNPSCVRFTASQWKAKIREIAEVGMENLVLMSTALYDRSFYNSKIFPKWDLGCDDPLESVLSAADKYGVRFFISNGFYSNWRSSIAIADPLTSKKRKQAMEEIAHLYAHHRSFYGWYWPHEASINGHYSEEFIRYVNASSKLARQLTPKTQILIAPYGTRKAIPDDVYVRQLEAIDVDIIAYQDEVGVRKSKVTETSAFYEGLRKAHDRAQRAKIWADIELFEFEGEVYNSALLPSHFSRVQKQIEAVSPWVEKILGYQYQGMMNKPGSEAFAGSPASTKLYSDYINWRNAQKFSCITAPQGGLDTDAS